MRGNSSFDADVPVTGTALFVTTDNAPLPNPEKLCGTCFPHEPLNDDISKGNRYRPDNKGGRYASLCK